MESESHTAVGIDLGTSNSVISIFKENSLNPEIVENLETGSRITPSYIQIENNKQIIGEVAKKNRTNKKYMDKVLYDMKRLIGRTYNDDEFQKDLQSNIWKFKVVRSEEGRPNIEIEVEGKKELYNPEEISGFLLQKLMNFANLRAKEKLVKAVITVPARFNNAQRDSTRSAGLIALLDVIGIISEPTAAALAYGYGIDSLKNSTLLVFDLGAGTLDLSLLELINGKLTVIATEGNTHLGGRDFDNELYKYVKKQFELKGRRFNDIKSNKLLNQCEEAKITLTQSESATIVLDFGDDESEEIEISRKLFEKICSPLIDKIFGTNGMNNGEIHKILNIANEKNKEIDEVLLIGGATRMKKIEEKLFELFGNKVNKKVNQDEAVAIGAAIYARSIIDGINKELFDDVTPLSIGILDSDGTMKPLINRFTQIPCYGIKTFDTIENNQKEADINVYEGEDFIHGEKNNFIDRAIFRGLPLKPKGKCHIKIKLSINENGIIEMEAEEEDTENKLQVVLSRPGLLSQQKLDELIKKFQKMQDNHKVHSEIKQTNLEFREYLNNLENEIKNNKNNEKNADLILNKINSIRNCFKEFGEQSFGKEKMEKWKIQLENLRTKKG